MRKQPAKQPKETLTVTERIFSYNRDRPEDIQALKYKLLCDNPVRFLRGTCHLFYEDWSLDFSSPKPPITWVCGDLHLENFGSFQGNNGLVYFDINDFDEAYLAPCTVDLVRLITSIILSGRWLKVGANDVKKLCRTFLEVYAATLAEGKAGYLEQNTTTNMLKTDMVKKLLLRMKKGQRKDFLARRTILKNKKRRFILDGIHYTPVTDEERSTIHSFIEAFRATQHNPDVYTVMDVAHRLAGTGSLGLSRYAVLIGTKSSPDNHFVLDVKKMTPSALQFSPPALANKPWQSIRQPQWLNEAHRVVEVQKRMQMMPPPLLNAVEIQGVPFIIRELQPTAGKVNLEEWGGDITRLRAYIVTIARVTAWAQLRSSGRQGSAIADELIEFAEHSQRWFGTLLDYAETYSKNAIHDFQEFKASYSVLQRKPKR